MLSTDTQYSETPVHIVVLKGVREVLQTVIVINAPRTGRQDIPAHPHVMSVQDVTLVRLVVVMGRDFVSTLQPGGFLYYPWIKANVTE
jgi:hypothetical protein